MNIKNRFQDPETYKDRMRCWLVVQKRIKGSKLSAQAD